MPSPPRSDVVDNDSVGIYHCFNHCSQRAFLCGFDPVTQIDFGYRQDWTFFSPIIFPPILATNPRGTTRIVRSFAGEKRRATKKSSRDLRSLREHTPMHCCMDVMPVDATSFRRLETCPQLKTLGLGGSSLTDEVLKNSEAYKHVSFLYLKDCNVTDNGLSALTDSKLETLGLRGNQFTDAAIPHLKAIPNLKTLSLESTSITPAAIAELRKEIPGIVMR